MPFGVPTYSCVQCWDATKDSKLDPKDKDKRPAGLLWEAGQFTVNGEIVAAFSPDCKRFLISTEKENALHLWDFEQSKDNEVRLLEGHKFPVTGVAFSPDGKRAASSSLDKTVRIWDVATGKELWTLPGHANDVTCVAWLPDGRHVVSGSTDKTVRLWEIPDTQAQ